MKNLDFVNGKLVTLTTAVESGVKVLINDKEYRLCGTEDFIKTVKNTLQESYYLEVVIPAWDLKIEGKNSVIGIDESLPLRMALEERLLNLESDKHSPTSFSKFVDVPFKDEAEVERLTDKPETVLQYHGLAAYSGQTDFQRKLDTLLQDDTIICGSDRAIGPVGILFEGSVHKMYARDIWSEVEDRQSCNRNLYIKEMDFLKLSKTLIGHKQYIETFTQVDYVYGVWCHVDVPQHIKEEVEHMARGLNLPVTYVRPSRIGKELIKEEFGDYIFDS